MAQHSSVKTFILDTNVILHDPSCIHQFQDNNIVIPLAVIEEIDRFKRGNDEKARNEAQFRAEPFVRDVLERFDATIRPGSIKPVS